MKTTKHTAGPWRVGWEKIVDTEDKAVCMVTYRKDAENHDLLAAAPDLLDAAKAALRALRSYNPGPLADKADPVRVAIIDAITKAEGSGMTPKQLKPDLTPELLAALEAMDAVLDGPIGDILTGEDMAKTGAYDAIEKARAAIAKATAGGYTMRDAGDLKLDELMIEEATA